ncbi:Hypothetical_protein [Hexamita inflata]|uniref:Hypothetical_protein n=1 Tax=Hexamita inflata TaxID=28002 RepID=A0AA86QMT6_9EUKA|nr:Hypothetical protein HINF_LOCUS42235 [Hexamita inflata]
MIQKTKRKLVFGPKLIYEVLDRKQQLYRKGRIQLKMKNSSKRGIQKQNIFFKLDYFSQRNLIVLQNQDSVMMVLTYHDVENKIMQHYLNRVTFYKCLRSDSNPQKHLWIHPLMMNCLRCQQTVQKVQTQNISGLFTMQSKIFS